MPRKKTEKTEIEEDGEVKKEKQEKEPEKKSKEKKAKKDRSDEKKEKIKEEKTEEKEHSHKKDIVEKEPETLLVPLEEYIKSGVHLGTRVITPNMREYVYRRKADGVAIMNTKKIDEKVEKAANFLSDYNPEDIFVSCKRDAGHKALDAFEKATNIKTSAKYMAGSITNPALDTFFEPKIVFVVDPWLDKNALNDAVTIHIPVVALCSTNNVTGNIDVVVPCNNKSARSIGLMLYIVAKLYLEKRKIKHEIKAEDFYDVEFEKTEANETKRRIERQRMGV